MKCGEIWCAELPEPEGSEPVFCRPILVIRSDDFNHSRNRTILGAAITSNPRLAPAPGNVSLPKRGTSLSKRSAFKVSWIVTVDKSFLTERAGFATDAALQQVKDGLRLILSQ